MEEYTWVRMQKIDFISDINEKFANALGYEQVDRYMKNVLLWHLAALTLLIFTNAILKISVDYPSPLSWRVITPGEGLVAALIGLAAAFIPISLYGKFKNHYHWRILLTVALVTYSYLFVFISGGSIEMHFHFFIIAALLVMYADWRLGWVLLVLTGLHHGILNYFQPGWVYFYGRNDFAVISHAIPVLVMVIFTSAICETIRSGVLALDLTNRGYLAEKDAKKSSDS